MITLDDLRPLAIFAGLPDEELAWFRDHGVEVELGRGEHMFERGQPADYMFVVVDGVIQRFEEIAGQWLVVATTARGEVTGMLPFSRMTHYPGNTVGPQCEWDDSTDDAACKLLYLAIRNAGKTWGAKPHYTWNQALLQFAIHFPGRIPEA